MVHSIRIMKVAQTGFSVTSLSRALVSVKPAEFKFRWNLAACKKQIVTGYLLLNYSWLSIFNFPRKYK